jgi:hypothetical protein
VQAARAFLFAPFYTNRSSTLSSKQPGKRCIFAISGYKKSGHPEKGGRFMSIARIKVFTETPTFLNGCG